MEILVAFIGGMFGATFLQLVREAWPVLRDGWKYRLLRKLDGAFPTWRYDVKSRSFEKWLDENPGMRDKVNSLRYDDAAECLRAYYAK